MNPSRKISRLPHKKDDARTFDIEKHLRQFCSSTSHELSNALGTIAGELDYALCVDDERVKARAIQIALCAAERALHLALNLNYFAAHTRLDVETVEVSQIFIDTVDIVERELQIRRIHISMSVEASSYAKVDVSALQQILLNLILFCAGNLPSGGKISLTLERSPRNLTFICADNGSVIPPERLDKLFEPQSVTHHSENHGLGLSVVKALVEAHGGSIEVASKENQGTVFRVLFPTDLSDQPSSYRQKRKHRRVKVSMPAQLVLTAETIPCEVAILNLSGCQLKLLDPKAIRMCDLESQAQLRICYFGDETIRIHKTRIASMCGAANLSAVGVEFVEMDLEARKILSAIIKSHSA